MALILLAKFHIQIKLSGIVGSEWVFMQKITSSIDFFRREYEEELQNETIKTIHTTFQNLRDIDIIVIYIDLL